MRHAPLPGGHNPGGGGGSSGVFRPMPFSRGGEAVHASEPSVNFLQGGGEGGVSKAIRLFLSSTRAGGSVPYGKLRTDAGGSDAVLKYSCFVSQNCYGRNWEGRRTAIAFGGQPPPDRKVPG